jgi:glycosyltransferase involved in cell wall biosynthesis
MKYKLPITAIILTFNEEKNIKDCIDSIYQKVNQIIVVDSFSTDKTIEIVQSYEGVEWVQNPFENYSIQRNWAFNNTNIQNDFVLNLDADHRVMPELIDELRDHFQKGVTQDINGFMTSRRTMFLGRWIKFGGHFPIYHAIIFRKGFGYCEEKKYDQHFVIEGKHIILKNNVIDIITESLSVFTHRHNNWSTLEAEDAISLLSQSHENKVKPDKNGNPMENRRYKRLKYYSLPIFWRVFVYFFFRFIIRGGFRDGKEGLVFHFLQGFWFRFLVDAKIWEINNKQLKK